MNFTSKFWKDLFACLGIDLAFNIAYHTHTYGKIERVNRILEDMLRMYVMHQQRRWEEYLPLVEFSYKNGYKESLKMCLFETLYRQSCITHISWSNIVNIVLIEPNMLAKME